MWVNRPIRLKFSAKSAQPGRRLPPMVTDGGGLPSLFPSNFRATLPDRRLPLQRRAGARVLDPFTSIILSHPTFLLGRFISCLVPHEITVYVSLRHLSVRVVGVLGVCVCLFSGQPLLGGKLTRELSARFELPDPVAPLPDSAAAVAASSTQEPPGMLLGDLEQWALQYQPTLAESAALVDAGRWNRLQVGLPPNPTLGYLASEIGDEGRAGQQGGFVEQTFIRGGKLPLNRAVAQHEVERRGTGIRRAPVARPDGRADRFL